MNNKKAMIIFFIMFVLAGSDVFSGVELTREDKEHFVQLNPDVNKYEFVKDFLESLTYFELNDKRSRFSQVEIDLEYEEAQKSNALLKTLIQNNVNLRVARNMIKNYRKAENGLMINVANLFVDLCDTLIKYNSRDIDILGKIYELQVSGDNPADLRKTFLDQQNELSIARKESLMKLLESSILVTKILISPKTDNNGKYNFIGITSDQRDKLLYKLDGFYGDQYQGELRPGQSFLAGSVSVIREVLEDHKLQSI